MSIPFTRVPPKGSFESTVYDFFPKTVAQWSSWFLIIVLGSAVIYGVVTATNPTNPFWNTLGTVTLAILPFAYIGWSLVTKSSVFLYYRTLTVGVLSLAVTLIAQSVGSPAPGSWADKWKTMFGDVFQAILQASFFVVPYVAITLR